MAAVLFLGATSQADATTRYAVAGGIGNSLDCTSTGDNCSLRWVLENVVLANDEVVVTAGTHDLGTSGVIVRSGSTPLNIHGADGEPRPSIVATTSGSVLGNCGSINSDCPVDLMTFRHLQFQNLGTGYTLSLLGGPTGNPLTIDDVQVVAGSAGDGIALAAQKGATGYAFIRNTTVLATGGNRNAIGSNLNLTMRNVTAVATGAGPGSFGLNQGANCGGGDCTGAAQSNVFNSILDGGPSGADVRGILSFNGFAANVSLDYSNFDSVSQCAGCTDSAPGSAHNQTALPLLADKAGGDFHELAGSPTIDAGIDDPANGLTDLDGNPRKLGPAPDIGAYETAGPAGSGQTGTTTGQGTTTNTPAGSQVQLQFGGVTITLVLPNVLKVKRKSVYVPITCPAGVIGSCAGRITIVTASKVLVPKVATTARKRKKLTLGKTSFSIPPGQTKKVRVKLSKAALKLLGAKGKVKAVLGVRMTANGVTKSAAKKVTVKGKKKRR